MRRLWVIGDSWTDPAYGAGPLCGWPQQVAARLGLALVLSGDGGSGYTRVNARNITHVKQAASGAGIGADAAVLWGSINDTVAAAPAGLVYDAATAALRLVRAALPPGAPILVYGPQGTEEGWQPLELEHVAAVRHATAEAGAMFMDTLDWMLGRDDLMDTATHHPHCGGHDYIAERVALDLAWALAVRCADPPADRSQPEPGWPMPVELAA